jgi:hypothetical protein
MTSKVVVMISSQRPKEREVSRFRHGNDPPEQVQAFSAQSTGLAFNAIPESIVPVTVIPVCLRIYSKARYIADLDEDVQIKAMGDLRCSNIFCSLYF